MAENLLRDGLGRRQRTLAETIDHMRFNAEDDELSQMLEEIKQDGIDAASFRGHASQTQKRQDRVLSLYTDYLLMARHISQRDVDELSDRDRDLKLFPANEQTVLGFAREFVCFVARSSSNRRGGRINYATLTSYRAAIMFWIDRIYNMYDIPQLNKSKMFNGITEAMRAAAKW